MIDMKSTQDLASSLLSLLLCLLEAIKSLLDLTELVQDQCVNVDCIHPHGTVCFGDELNDVCEFLACLHRGSSDGLCDVGRLRLDVCLDDYSGPIVAPR